MKSEKFTIIKNGKSTKSTESVEIYEEFMKYVTKKFRIITKLCTRFSDDTGEPTKKNGIYHTHSSPIYRRTSENRKIG